MSRVAPTILSFVLSVSTCFAQAKGEVDRYARSTEQRLGSETLGYTCAEFRVTDADFGSELQRRVSEANGRGDYTYYCSPYRRIAKASEKSVGIRDGGIVVFVGKNGVLRQPYLRRD
jgi:hypothetical protein